MKYNRGSINKLFFSEESKKRKSREKKVVTPVQRVDFEVTKIFKYVTPVKQNQVTKKGDLFLST